MNGLERLLYRGKRCAKYISLSVISDYLGYENHTTISLFEKNQRNISDEKIEKYKNFIDGYQK